MLEILLQMAALIACGTVWRVAKPGGMDADTTRRALTSLVYYLLLPALVLNVLWRAPLTIDTPRIALVASAVVLASLALGFVACRVCRMPKASAGAALLAAAFPNATYLGLPVLEKTLGPWARPIAIQYDLFACTPLLLTVGILIAYRMGDQSAGKPTILGLFSVPAFIAAIAATGLNAGHVTMPAPLETWLEMLGSGVSLLMLISLGLSLKWEAGGLRRLPALLPIATIQLAIAPLIAWGLCLAVGMPAAPLSAVVLEAAMPSMVLGLVICDRYGLDTGLYATAVTATTLLSLFTLPLWFGLLGVSFGVS